MLSKKKSYPKIDRGRPLQKSGKTLKFGDFGESTIVTDRTVKNIHNITL